MIWYRLKADEILKTLSVDQKVGLSDTEADKRLSEYGDNKLVQEQKASINELHHLLQMSAGCNDALMIECEGVHTIQGMPTEGALAVVAAKANITKQGLIDKGTELIHSFPFDSTRKLIFGQIFHIFNARTFSTLYHKNPWNNRYLLAAVPGSALLSLGLIYSGLGTVAFGTEPLALKHLVMVIAIAALPIFVLSGLKEIFHIKWV